MANVSYSQAAGEKCIVQLQPETQDNQEGHWLGLGFCRTFCCQSLREWAIESARLSQVLTITTFLNMIDSMIISFQLRCEWPTCFFRDLKKRPLGVTNF